MEMAKVVKAATNVLTAHKQKEMSSFCTLATNNMIFASKKLKF
jgi:hypothetical protein